MAVIPATQISQEQIQQFKQQEEQNGSIAREERTLLPDGTHNAYLAGCYVNTRAETEERGYKWRSDKYDYQISFRINPVDQRYKSVYKKFEPEIFPAQDGYKGSPLWQFLDSLFRLAPDFQLDTDSDMFKRVPIRVTTSQTSRLNINGGRPFIIIEDILPGHAAQPAPVEGFNPHTGQAPQPAPQPQQQQWAQPADPSWEQQQAPQQQQQFVQPQVQQQAPQQFVQPQAQQQFNNPPVGNIDDYAFENEYPS